MPGSSPRSTERAPSTIPRLEGGSIASRHREAGSTIPRQETSSSSAPRCRSPSVVSVELLLEQRQPLREQDVLIGETRDHRRIVQQHGEDEEDADREQHGGRIAANSDPAGDRVESAAPRGERCERESREQPEKRISLPQPVTADELEHDEYECERRDCAGDRDCERRHVESSCGTTLRRKRPTKIASKTLTM